MAENVQETNPPEPPQNPPEVPKPTERPTRSEAKDHNQPNESQLSAHEDARIAAQSEHAAAMRGREPDGLQLVPIEDRDTDTRAVPSIAEEIASSPVDVRTKPHINSAGESVDRNIVDDADDLFPLAEHLGLGELSHDKDDYYSGQLPDGRYRKIEWNMDGHVETDEGPHIKVMETEDPWSAPAKGNRWKAKAMIFVDGHESYKKQWH